MRWQRRIALSVLACLLVGAAGCGGSQPPPEEPTAGFVIPPPSTQGYVPPVAEPRVVTLAVELYAGGREWIEASQQEINRLLEEEGTTLRLEMVGVSVHQSALVQQLENQGIQVDLFMTDFTDSVNPSGAFTLYQLEQKGMIADITDSLERFADLYAIHPQSAWREASIDGRVLGFPLTQADITGVFTRQTGIEMRPGWLETLEGEFPRTIDELTTLLLRARDAGMPYKILASSSAPPYAFHRTYEQWPFYVDEKSRFVFYPDGSVEPYIGSEIFLLDAKFLRELQDLDLLSVNIESGSNRAQYDGDRSQLAMALYPNYVDRGERPYDHLAPGAPTFLMQPAALSAVYVSAHCEDVDAAVEMLQYLYSHPEISLAFAYGVEGVDWVRQPDGAIERVEAREMQGFFLHGLSLFGPTDPRWERTQSTPSVDLPAPGFMRAFDQGRPPVSYDDLYALRLGSISMTELDAVTDDLYEQGFFDMLEECKRQYAEFIK